MKRLIDANEVLQFPSLPTSGYEEMLKDLIEEHMPEEVFVPYEEELTDLCKATVCAVMNVVKTSPTVDAVEVVRCKECRHYDTEDCCEGFGWCTLHDRGLNDEGFCSEGKRRSD